MIKDQSDYQVEGFKPEIEYLNKSFKINNSLIRSTGVLMKVWETTGVTIDTNRELLWDLSWAPFNFSTIWQSNLQNTFGLPSIHSLEQISNF